MITGKVKDSLTGKPVEYATITLHQAGDKNPLNGTVAGKNGEYELSSLDAGEYKIVIESIGYRSSTIDNISLNKKNTTIVLPVTALMRNIVIEQAATVVGSNSLIENKIDKVVFNAEKDLTSQGGVATDILKKVPQVSVDVDGNVELAGSASIRFLINGKPSSAFGSNIADVLQSIPASQIKSIEVITNPGAKYDAQGLGGIINIILKQSKVKGINGNLSLTAGTRNENGSFNLNARKGDFGMNMFVSGNTRLAATISNKFDRFSTDTAGLKDISLQQNSSSRFKRYGIESGIGFDWTYRKKNNFTGSFRYAGFGNSGAGVTEQLQVVTMQNGGPVVSSIAVVNNSSSRPRSHNTDAAIGYKRTFDKEDQELEISFNSSAEKSRGRAANYQLLQPQDSLYYGTNSINPGRESETELSIDYAQPLKEDIMLGVGGKINYVNISSTSDITSYDPATRLYLYDSSLSNSLNYKQKVYALYGEISFPAGNWFDAKLGGRYERTEINSFYSNAQQQTPQHGYNTFVPSIFFSRKIGDNQTIKLNFSKRIERPDLDDLNPFINTSDAKNISAGNPYLLPETGKRYELSYSRNFKKGGSLMATAYYRINNNDIQPFIVFYPSLTVGDSVYTNATVTIRQNIGTEKNMGMNLFVDVRPATKLGLRSNLSFFRRHTINVLNPGYNSNSFNYRFNVNASYQFNNSFAGEFFGSFSSARNEAQGKYPSFTSYSIALRKQFWNKKGSLALSVTNPFNKYVNQETALFGPNFKVNSLRQVPFRSISLNFTWKFGRLEFKKEDNKDVNVPGGEGL